jgi:hypothetical protein
MITLLAFLAFLAFLALSETTLSSWVRSLPYGSPVVAEVSKKKWRTSCKEGLAKARRLC